ncbi:MAG: class I SAM-dependent methyltransferase [Chloroflexia bacterium]
MANDDYIKDQYYEYRGLIAQSWDLLRGDTSNWDDRFFYKEVVRRTGDPVLDVGCGTGRLLLDFMADGVDIDGVDNSPEMLALLREKAEGLGLQPNVYQQTMEALALPRKYRTIIVPSSSFQLVISPEDAGEAMRRFHAHLLSGGTLAMPFMILWSEASGHNTTWDWHNSGEAVRPDGLTVRRWSRSTFDTLEKLEHTEDRFELLRDGEVIDTENHVRSPGVRWYTQEEAVALYREAGFEEVQMYKHFTWEPASPEDNIFVLSGHKP